MELYIREKQAARRPAITLASRKPNEAKRRFGQVNNQLPNERAKEKYSKRSWIWHTGENCCFRNFSFTHQGRVSARVNHTTKIPEVTYLESTASPRRDYIIILEHQPSGRTRSNSDIVAALDSKPSNGFYPVVCYAKTLSFGQYDCQISKHLHRILLTNLRTRYNLRIIDNLKI